MQIKQNNSKYFIGLLFIVSGVAIFLTNYTVGTYLMGWDNVMPEFNFWANLTRTLSAVWQEHRGLGLYDGMAHSANVIHTIIVGLLSLILPQSSIRYVVLTLLYVMGGYGVAKLVQHMFHLHHTSTSIRYGLPIISGIFYMLNIATIQMMVVPLESFIFHFAFLPYLFLTTHLFLEKPSRKQYGYMILTYLISSTQFFIPTLLFATSLIIVIPCVVYGIKFLRNHNTRVHLIFIPIVLLTFACTQSYWLLPWIYGLPTNAPIIKQAKINVQSSEEVFSQNQAYGDIFGVLSLRGWVFDQTELNGNNSPEFLLGNFRALYLSPVGTVITWFILFTVFLGLLKAIGSKQYTSTYGYSILLLFITGLFLLGTNIPVFRDIQQFLRSTFPLLAEAYRFPFTKFILLFGFAYSVLFAYGLVFIFSLFHDKRTVKKSIFVSFIVIIGVMSIPIWQGDLFSSVMKVRLPKDYQQLFSFFKTLPPTERVVFLPQTSFWSWKYYSYGYRGSGYTWYGIQQPTMDRAFDPWSDKNEAFYWELSHALYSKNADHLSQVLNKYMIQYLVFDSYIQATAGNNRALFEEQTKTMLSALPTIQPVFTTPRLQVYKHTGVPTTSFVSVANTLPSVFPTAQWFDIDTAYANFSYYANGTASSADVYMPFRSFFSKRTYDESLFTIKEKDDLIVIEPVVKADISFLSTEIGATPSAIVDGFNQQIKVDKNKSKVFTADSRNFLKPEYVTTCSASEFIHVDKKSQASLLGEWLSLLSSNGSVCLKFGRAQVPHVYGYLVSVTSKHIQGKPLTFTIIDETSKQNTLEVTLPNNKEWQTTYYFLPPRASDGLDYSFIISNKAIGPEISENNIKSIEFFQFPYSELQNLYVSEQILTTGILESPNSVFHPHPAYYLTSITNEPTLILSQAFHPGWKAYEVDSKLGEMFPFIFGKEIKNHVLVNNWANGWELNNLEFTRLPASMELQRGEPARQEIQNSELPRERTIVIFFLPQLLQWMGFGLLPLPFLLFFLTRKLFFR